MRLRSGLFATLAMLAVTGYADACGPDFPTSLAFTREKALQELPANSFPREMAALLGSERKDFLPVEDADTADGKQRAALLEVPGDDDDLDPASQASMIADRQATRAYVDGAEIFLQAQERQDNGRMFYWFDKAAQAFARAANGDGPDWLAVRAAYMQGRAEAARLRHSQWSARCRIDPALGAFQQVRALVQQGRTDPLGLALSSFGEEARVLLDLQQADADCPDFNQTEALEHAVTLYAEQAARGDSGSVESLRIVASLMLGDEALFKRMLPQPMAQRLMAIYLVHKAADWAAETPIDMAVDSSDVSHRLVRFLAALDTLPEGSIAAADRLAAILYKAGRYDDAARMLQRANGPLGDWIGAKLALRGNDPVRAASLLVKAQRGLEAMGDAVAPAYLARLKGEQGIVALNRDDIIGAMQALHAAGGRYWEDIAYLGERVMTIAELRAFVDTLPKGPRVEPQEGQYGWQYLDVSFDLRYLLARRMAREGDLLAAKLYMPEAIPDDYWHKDMRPATWLDEYASALQRADKAWLDASRAEALFAAAMLQRQRGMELFGYELHPDYKIYEGGFGAEHGEVYRFDLPETAKPTKLEQARFEATRPAEEIRFQYRYRASEQAVQVAELLPPRSQAYAAVLCHATRWMLQSHAQDRAEAIYKRYLSEGAYVSWGKDFGQKCPEPDFAAARSFHLRQAWPETRAWLRGLLR